MKICFSLCACLLLSLSTLCQKKVIIQGKILSDTISGQVLLLRGLNPFPAPDVIEVVDSALIKKGRFKLKFQSAEAEMYFLRIQQTNHFIGLIGIPGDKTNLTWTINGKESSVSSSGSEENAQYINKLTNQGRPIIKDLNRFFDSSAMYKKRGDTVLSKYFSLQNQYWFDSLQKYYVHLVYEKPQLFSSLFTMSKLHKNFPDDYVKTYLNNLPTSLKENKLANEIKYIRFIQPAELQKIRTFADFNLSDSVLQPFSYQPYLGKIVLIDFWASWCKPCIENFPKIKSLIAKTDSNKFAVIGVSLDDTHNAWLLGLRRLQLGWMNTWDTKSWKGMAAMYYKIKSIPRYVLLGEDGTVINSNIDGDNLEESIMKYIKN